jgi:2-methylcitrate dehydratase PrpD
MNAAARIAHFAQRMNSAPLSDSQRHPAYRALLDTVAVAIAGRNEAAVHIAHSYARTLGSGHATVWHSGETLHPEAAAWLNGVTAHVLDYDDVMTMMRGHISVAMVPALVALAQHTGATGEQYARAYLAGFELMAKLSRVMALPHYSKGWHSTSALGVLGAALACSVLLGLDQSQTSHALGLAVAQAAGTRGNFGTHAKSFQAGQCNAAAVRAALLAQSGFTASESVVDGKYGYLALYAANEDVSAALATLGQTYNGPLEIETTGIDIKKYPCCYAIHRALDALFALRAQHKPALDDVESIAVTNSAGGLDALQSRLPLNGLEAKFSMQYNMAAALVDGAIRLSSFDDAQVARASVAALMPRVGVSEASGAILPRWSHVKLTLRDGRVLEQRVSVARGDAGDPLSDDELLEKAVDCFAFGQFGGDAHAFGARVLGMTDTRVDGAINALRHPKIIV